MGKCDKLLEKARNNPAGLRFEEACKLAECFGFVFARQRGSSHCIYKAPGQMGLINVQEGENGKAKPYQVRQILKTIESLEE
jgi:predicted RNA binding protein YcfA (HicA-like mRNA interferase family)